MAVSFDAPRDVNFTCSRCGDCCRTWSVVLGPGERERIEALDWGGREQDLAAAALTVEVSTARQGGLRRLARREDGACVFLGAESQCRIHERFGEDSKPLLCRMYPFGFYAMGDRVAVDVSFACRAVSEGRGEPITAREPEWTRLLGATAPTDTRRHELRPGQPISGQLVWAIEHRLVQLLADSSMSMLQRVRSAIEFLHLGTTGDPALPTAKLLREAMASGIPRKVRQSEVSGTMDRSQRALFYQWLTMALNPAPANFELLETAGRQALERERLQAGERFRDNKGRPTVDNRELGVSFEAIAEVSAAWLAHETCEPIATFLQAKIVGQKFLASPAGERPLVEAGHALFLTYPMTIWTAKALAADRGARAVEEGDVRRALRLVDRTFGQSSMASLPKKQAEACAFLLTETDLVTCAVSELTSPR